MILQLFARTPVTGSWIGMPSQHDFGDSVLNLALDPSSSPATQNGNGWGLKVVDYFTPFNQATLNANDTDLGSGGALILPDSAGSTAHPHLLLTAGKEGKLYLIDRDAMGHFDPNTDHVVQEVAGALHADLGNPAYFNGNVYSATPGFGTDNAKEFSIANAVLSTAPVSTSPAGCTARSTLCSGCPTSRVLTSIASWSSTTRRTGCTRASTRISGLPTTRQHS